MKRFLAVTLGILTAIGGFVDIGDLGAGLENDVRGAETAVAGLGSVGERLAAVLEGLR